MEASNLYILWFEDREHAGKTDPISIFQGKPSIQQIADEAAKVREIEGSTVFTERQYNELIEKKSAPMGYFHVVYLEEVEVIKGEGSTSEILKRTWQFCGHNRKNLEVSEKAGCFYCLEIFDSSEIQEFVDDDTALCPHCSVDSVLPDSEVKLSTQLLWDMHQAYFTKEK